MLFGVEKIPWETTSMAEDAEYTLKLAIENIKAKYAHKAVVYAEHPTLLRPSVFQRIRWAQGITDVQRDFMGKLIMRGKWNVFFRFWSDLLMPLCFIVLGLLDLFSILNILGVTSVAFVAFWIEPIPFIMLKFYILGTISTILCGLIHDKKYNHKLLLNIFGLCFYLISWLPAGIYGILKRNKTEWYHTKHKSTKS